MEKQFYKTTNIHDDYQIKQELGEGSFAKVYQGVRKSDGLEVAIKIFDKKTLEYDDQMALETEVEIMSAVDHPNIVKLFQVYDDKKYFYMILELMTGGELFDRIIDKEQYTEQEAQESICPIVDAISYCHSLEITHRDLKPENLLLATPDSNAIIKISDFGLAKVVSQENFMVTACGTPSYMAPEVLTGKGYSNAVDFWSIGVILYVLLCGYPPFDGESNEKLFQQIQSGKIDFPDAEWKQISQQAKDLIKNLLQVDPKKRFNAEQILNHPWMKGEGVSDKQLNGVTSGIKNIQKGKSVKIKN
ncbi:Protein kinase-like domain [Pseudocohnilembus persalinus]|uniref:non-specific serine/threonine protein kinase n=1 Tax=Pseudocohnilembus persalinus TaxID=266149 RepID=A0A0V0QVB6_PSEPJ|nr:Protein kinase-like domain [Pseudocohnilembus persalinus]|eukprot:KRX05936.1 Protein kinase-like domain [Pseudocohnilembus persalinus]